MRAEPEPAPIPAKDIAMAMYNSLREEIQTHINVQYTVLSFTLVVVGTIITFVAQGQIGPEALMAYPILALFPALVWTANQVAIIRIAVFLQKQFERFLPRDLRWEQMLCDYKRRGYRSRVDTLYSWGIFGIFFGSQVLMLTLAAYLLIIRRRAHVVTPPVGILIVLDAAALSLMGWILLRSGRDEGRWLERLGDDPGCPPNDRGPDAEPRQPAGPDAHQKGVTVGTSARASRDERSDEFGRLLVESDRSLVGCDVAEIRACLSRAATVDEEGLWTTTLGEIIRHASRQDIVRLAWTTEKHYAGLIRRFGDDPSQAHSREKAYLIGYARVTSLMTRVAEPSSEDSPADLRFVLAFLQQAWPDATTRSRIRILDIGCGSGRLLVDLVRRGYSGVVGIDIAPAAVRRAREKLWVRRLAGAGLHCVSMNDFRRRFPGARFDLIIQSHVIEHILPAQTALFLGQAAACLGTPGYMIVITPSRLTGPHDDTRLYHRHAVPPEGFHMREYSLSELREVLSRAGFGCFRAMSSRPRAGWRGATISEENFAAKVRMEPLVESLDWKLRKPIVDGLYFHGLVCQREGS